jgi:hypothetical protein
MNKRVKLNRVISYLKGNEEIKTQKDFAEAIDFNHTNLSSAINGNENYLTDSLFEKILKRFPEVDFILNDEGGTNIINGDNKGHVISGSHHQINIEDTPEEEANPLNELLMIIRKKDEQIAKRDEQIDRLISILSNKHEP